MSNVVHTLGRIEGQLTDVLRRLDHADRARHDMRNDVQALMPLKIAFERVIELEKRVSNLELSHTRRTWFELGLAAAGGGGISAAITVALRLLGD